MTLQYERSKGYSVKRTANNVMLKNAERSRLESPFMTAQTFSYYNNVTNSEVFRYKVDS